MLLTLDISVLRKKKGIFQLGIKFDAGSRSISKTDELQLQSGDLTVFQGKVNRFSAQNLKFKKSKRECPTCFNARHAFGNCRLETVEALRV